MPGKIVSIINLKGGVGKTTLAMLLGEYAAWYFRKRVLLVDFDSQQNLTSAMIRPLWVEEELRPQRKTVYDLFSAFLEGKDIYVEDFRCPESEWVSNITRDPGIVLDMIISTPELAQLDEDMLNYWESVPEVVRALLSLWQGQADEVESLVPGISSVLSSHTDPSPPKRALSQVRMVMRELLASAIDDYDLIIVDCPPGLSLFTSAAIVASDYFLSPVIPEPLSILGIDQVVSRIARLTMELEDVAIDFAGCVLSKVLHYRKAHHTTALRLMGHDTGPLAKYPPAKYRVLGNWIPDAEHMRKLGDHDTVMLREEPGSGFGGVYNKYGGNNVTLTHAAYPPLSFGNAPGSKYYLSQRLCDLAGEVLDRTGVAR